MNYFKYHNRYVFIISNEMVIFFFFQFGFSFIDNKGPICTHSVLFAECLQIAAWNLSPLVMYKQNIEIIKITQ